MTLILAIARQMPWWWLEEICNASGFRVHALAVAIAVRDAEIPEGFGDELPPLREMGLL